MKKSFSKILNVGCNLLIINILFASSLTLNVSDIDKFQIENNLNSKITNVISNFYNKDQFAVTSNVLLISSNSPSSNSAIKSFGALELEGILPAVPQSATDGIIKEENNYKIQIQDITVWLDYELDVINAQQNIKKFLFESIDWLANCDNCLKFRSKAFPGNNKFDVSTTSSSNINSNNMATEDDLRILEDNIAYLTEQIEKYEENNSTEKNQWMIDFLNRALQEEKELNANLSDQILENARNVQKRDSSIIMKTLDIPEAAMENNANMVEQVFDNQSKTNYFLWAVVFILITLYSILIFFNKGPKTVYLKPRKNSDDTDTKETTEDNNENVVSQSDNHTVEAEDTRAYEDESVIQSDLKTIKQSAVKMSVGQKQEASQILKDWLDEGNSEDSDNNDTDEENN